MLFAGVCEIQLPFVHITRKRSVVLEIRGVPSSLTCMYEVEKLRNWFLRRLRYSVVIALPVDGSLRYSLLGHHFPTMLTISTECRTTNLR